MRQGDTTLKLPIISYYGTGRLWDQHRENKNDTFEKNSRSNGYVDSLDGAANDKLIKKWFQKMTIQQYQREKSMPEYMAVCDAMAKCFQSITNCNDAKVQFNLDTNEIDVIYTNKNNEKMRMPVSQLSDGYKCTISLIADIAYRMSILNPQLLGNVLEETEGIVLIDEIDLHLHPIWQQRIISDLMAIFPKVQFIVSTHAPAVINSVSSDSLKVNPCQPETLSGISYRANGEIFSTDAIVNEDLNERINLNCQSISLPQSRKAALNGLLKDLRKQHAKGDIKIFCRRRLEELKQPQVNKIPYVGILIDWLEKHT